MALLSVSNLGFSYGEQVILDGVNLTIERGEHVGLVGLNGCGKSTLMKLIAALGDTAHMTGQLQLA
ncbi:MAG: ATP-binding cassette domain-containing protein, partial [Planctomycetota bacterium]